MRDAKKLVLITLKKSGKISHFWFGKWLGNDVISQTEIIFEKKMGAQCGIYLNRAIHSGAQVRAELIPMGEIKVRAETEGKGKNNVTQRKHID